MGKNDEYISVIRHYFNWWVSIDSLLYHVVCHYNISFLMCHCYLLCTNTNFYWMWVRASYDDLLTLWDFLGTQLIHDQIDNLFFVGSNIQSDGLFGLRQSTVKLVHMAETFYACCSTAWLNAGLIVSVKYHVKNLWYARIMHDGGDCSIDKCRYLCWRCRPRNSPMYSTTIKNDHFRNCSISLTTFYFDRCFQDWLACRPRFTVLIEQSRWIGS